VREYTPTSVAQHGAALARTTPEVERVREGVWVIPLPLPERGGVESTLCYSIADAEGGVHLIDPGWDTDANLARLEAGLAIAGFGLDDVRGVTATHLHPDHLGLGQSLRARGIPVGMHRREHVSLTRALYPEAEATMERWGVPESWLSQVVDALVPRSAPSGYGADLELDDGDLLDIPGRRLRVVATPGHTAGSICLHDEDEQLFFSGDHVLPIINPGLGLGGFDPDDDPIGAALDSYAAVAAYDEAEVCPGHGYRFYGLAVRAGQIADRHRRRSAEVGAIAAANPGATVWQIAEQVSWTDGWENLVPFMRLSALAQTELHLKHLARTPT